MYKILKDCVAAVFVICLLVSGLFLVWDSTPEMTWSQSKDRCVSVTQWGKKIPDGCQMVAKGKLTAERYVIK